MTHFSIQEKKKKALKQGVDIHSHFPLTWKISQHVEVRASHPGMDYGQVNGLRMAVETPMVTWT